MKKRVCISIGSELHRDARRFAASMEMDFSELLSILLRRAIECGEDRNRLVRWLHGTGEILLGGLDNHALVPAVKAAAKPISQKQMRDALRNAPVDDSDEEDECSEEQLEALSHGDAADLALYRALRQVKDDKEEAEGQTQQQTPVMLGKPPRNALCPCGSGKKFKRCCEASWPNLRKDGKKQEET